MLSDKQLAPLSPLARAFRILFLADLGSVPHAETFTDRYELTIPAADPSVGEICVWDDEDELTIHLGEHHHWHVPLYMYADESQATRPALAAATAIKDIRNVLEGRTVLRVRRHEGRVVSSTTYDRTAAKVVPPSPEDSEYLWTGPRTEVP